MKKFEPVRVQHCQNCGYPMRQYNPESMMMICQSCGTRTGENETPPKYGPRVPYNPLFKLGTAFELQGVTWQIIGCQSYTGVVHEWDSEDDVWEKTPWSYHTWWLLNEAREIAWIVQDKSGYSWSRKIPVTQAMPASGIPVRNKAYEIGEWSLLSAVGEFSYYPDKNERITSYEKDKTSLEIHLDDNGNNKEIEAFSSEPISLMDLLIGFDKQDAIAALHRAKLAIYAAFASAGLLLMGFFVLMLLEVTLLTVPETNIKQPIMNIPINLGEFSSSTQGVMEFKFRQYDQDLLDTGTFEANLQIFDANNQKVTELPFAFWKESGYDSDGKWVEQQEEQSLKVILPASENYKLIIQATRFTRWHYVSFHTQVIRNSASFSPIAIGLVLLIALGLIIMALRYNWLHREAGIIR